MVYDWLTQIKPFLTTQCPFSLGFIHCLVAMRGALHKGDVVPKVGIARLQRCSDGWNSGRLAGVYWILIHLGSSWYIWICMKNRVLLNHHVFPHWHSHFGFHFQTHPFCGFVWHISVDFRGVCMDSFVDFPWSILVVHKKSHLLLNGWWLSCGKN